jgi:peptidoglycan hydrolase-like protein with peptidoglycan-binding domain
VGRSGQNRSDRPHRSTRGRVLSAVVAVVLAVLAVCGSSSGVNAQSATPSESPTSTGTSTSTSTSSVSTATATTAIAATSTSTSSPSSNSTAGSSSSTSSNANTTSIAGSTASSTTLGSTGSTTTTTVAETTTTVPFKVGSTLHSGSRGDAVEAMERRLDLLKFDVGKVDGRYDSQTAQGVMAFQKVLGLKRTARFDGPTQLALRDAVTPGGLIPNGGLPRVEVDLTRQVLFFFDKFGLYKVANISSGSGKKYCDYSSKAKRQVCGSAKTPRGNFRVQRRIKGDRESDLGHLYSPVYFNGGFAVHGSGSIPAYPASHGCVRVSNRTADWFFSEVPDKTPVYLYD